MNKREKELQQAFLNNEKGVLKSLEGTYRDALDEINSKIELLMARQDADMQHVIYQVQYQQSLKKQVESILETMHSKEFETISDFLTASYEDGYIGALYNMQGQGIPLAFPVDPVQVAQAIQTETKLSEALYSALGKDIKTLQKNIAGEISRGLVTGAMYSEIARNVASQARIPLNNAMRITRTEAHRIQTKAGMDACEKAKSRGADVVKQWDSALDKRTRDSHVRLDGEIRELDKPFSNGLMYAGDPSGRAEEVINCRCAILQRAKWALDRDETKHLGDMSGMSDEELKPLAKKLHMDVDELRSHQDEIVPINASDYADFKNKYNQLWKYEGSEVQERAEKRIAGYGEKRVQPSVQKMNANVVQRLKDKNISVDIENAGNYKEEALQNLEHLDRLCQEYDSTTVSYTLVKGGLQEGGGAYMVNGRTAISVRPTAFKKTGATDALKLGENQPYGTTYHEFAHSLSQSREKTDIEFWKEMRKLKREYEGMRGTSIWFDMKISDYASKDVDEFLAEAFTQAKLSDNPSVYSLKVLEVVDKYFKKKH